MIVRPDIELANRSDAGCVRTVNEDYFGYVEPEDEEEFARRGRMIIVADGMGGHKGGEVASGMAVDILRDEFLTTAESDPRTILIEAFRSAHFAILESADGEPELHGMGTTCCAAILRGDELTYGHIGDSRIYLLRDGRGQLLTEDHTMVGNLLRTGAITVEEAKVHPQRNVLTAAMGSATSTIVGDFAEQPLPLLPGDTLLLCSDGLHGYVSEEEFEAIASGDSLSLACEQLVDLAKRRGGADNITVQILRFRGLPA